jgi:pSer/pThr/pTyr-binding forkhead associated (FHA) protein
MEPTALPPLPGQPSLPGELVVQNGRSSGARLPLNDPLTLIGQASGCDIRLNVDGVEPFHCAIVLDPAGPILRDLGTANATRVNGEGVTTHRLATGDVIEIGPFQLAVDLGTPRTAEVPSADILGLQREREALRVQAAAVAAQQAALTEQEARLEQRASALARQEEQIAAHLEQRQHDLDEQEHKLQAARADFQAQRDAQFAALETQRSELNGARAAIDTERQEASKQRQRVAALRRRLRQRWKRHWRHQEADLARRESDLAAGQQRLQQERARVTAFQKRINGERELGRRQIRDEWRELGLAQQQWEETLNVEQTEQARRKQELERLAAQIGAAREQLAQEQEQARLHQARLNQEAEGLEARIRNQRARLEVLQRDAARLAPPAVVTAPGEPIISPPVEIDQPTTAWPARLRELAAELHDQRARLAEQWQRLLEVQDRWQQERSDVLADLDRTAAELAGRERQITQSEEEVASLRAGLLLDRESLGRMRLAVQGWQARLASQDSSWQAQRELLLSDLEARERLLQRRQDQLEEVQRRRNLRRQAEVAELAQARQRCEEARRQYSALWLECERLREALVGQEQALAGRALALERSRQELITQAPDSARAEARLVRVERDETVRLEGETRHLQAQRDLLKAERGRLDELSAHLRQQGDELVQRVRQWQDQQTEWERQQASDSTDEEQRQQELRRLRVQHALDERQLRQLRDELEGLARLLIEEGDSPSDPPARQAA